MTLHPSRYARTMPDKIAYLMARDFSSSRLRCRWD